MGNVVRKEVYIGREKTGSKEYVTITDVETGDLIDGFWRVRRTQKQMEHAHKIRARFIKLYEKNWTDIVRRKRLDPYDTGIFVMLTCFMDWESNYLVHPDTRHNLSCSELADLLGVSRTHLHECLERLNAKGLVAIVKRGTGAPNHYLLNTNVVFKGSKIKDINEHQVFEKCAYEPAERIKYRERDDQAREAR